MAQGLDSKAWTNDKSPKVSETVKRTRVMGSRRIFPPQFKLQVLDSYRNDLDCRGNQRATARKYNIHRRQIQKWLQCEQNLRTSVEESSKNDEMPIPDGIFQIMGKKMEANTIVKNSDGKMDSALNNRSAMIYTRLTDAVRTREENAVRPTLKSETKVFQVDESTTPQLEAQNLKRVAQKLYPSSHSVSCETVNFDKGDMVLMKGGCPVGVPKIFKAVVLSSGENLDANFNRISSVADVPLDLKNKPRSEPDNFMPKETLCLLNDKPNEIFTVQTENATRSSPVRQASDKLTISGDNFSKSVLLRENIGRQKLCESNAVPKCLVQKYINDEGLKLCADDTTGSALLCSRIVDVESSSLLDPQVPVTSLAYPEDRINVPVGENVDFFRDRSSAFSSDHEDWSDSSTVADKRKCTDDLDVWSPKKAKHESDESKNQTFKNVDDEDHKSFRPKRKWIKESLQEMGSVSENAPSHSSSSSPVLPIKQRVKMNLKTASYEETTMTPSPKGVSPNFTIERLCSSDIKSENVTPISFHSPSDSDCYNWRPEPCNYATLPPLPPPVLPFPPPLILPHRVIPDLVSLHFKPEVFDQKDSQSVGSFSPNYEESLDIPLKQEKVSDSEETDVDVLSTTPLEKKTFDFSSYTTGKRRSFSVQFKLTVLDAFYNDKDCNKNQRATARKFNINRRQVQKWLSQENDLRSEGSVKNGKYLQRQRLGNDKEMENMEACTQCPQHCLRKRREKDELEKTIEVNVKHCSDKDCLSREKPSSENSQTHFHETLDYYDKNCFQSDLKSASIYDNFLIRENNNLVYHESILGWPNINASALQVPNFQYMPHWFHNFDYCHEKSKIY